jgi:hypothetical protein
MMNALSSRGSLKGLVAGVLLGMSLSQTVWAKMICEHRDFAGQEPPNRFAIDTSGPRVWLERDVLGADGKWRVEHEPLVDGIGIHKPVQVAAADVSYRFRDDAEVYGLMWNAGVLASGTAQVNRLSQEGEFVSVATTGRSKTVRMQLEKCVAFAP